MNQTRRINAHPALVELRARPREIELEEASGDLRCVRLFTIRRRSTQTVEPPVRSLRSLIGASLVKVKVRGIPGGRTQTLGGLQSPHPVPPHPAIELVNERRMRYNEPADGPPRLPTTPSLASLP